MFQTTQKVKTEKRKCTIATKKGNDYAKNNNNYRFNK